MHPQERRHIFFDLDGTLVDSFPGIGFSAGAAMDACTPGRIKPDFRQFIGPPIKDIFQKSLSENDATLLDALVQEFRKSYDGGGWKKTIPYPGVPETLRILSQRGVICHVLTNKPQTPTLRILDYLRLAGLFNEIITPEFRTPHYATKVEAALDAMRRLHLSGGNALVVGDSLDDAAAAQACDFQFAAITYGYGNAATQDRHPVHLKITAFSTLADVILAPTNIR